MQDVYSVSWASRLVMILYETASLLEIVIKKVYTLKSFLIIIF